jgi:predicted amidohydrolase
MTDGLNHVQVAVCQVDGVSAVADRAVLSDAVREAVGRGARLVVLPELAACGGVITTPEQARAAAEPLDGATVALCARLSAELDCVIVVGLAEAGEGGLVHNTAVLVDSGVVVTTYRKVHLWGAEKNAFQAGTARPPVVQTSVGRVGVMICYDLEFPEWVRLAAEEGADVLAVPANWPLRANGDRQRPFEVLKAQAAAVTYRLNLAVADRCGIEAGVDWYGASLVCDADGTLLAGPACAANRSGEPARPAVLVARVDLAAARDKRLGPYNHALGDRRPELYG